MRRLENQPGKLKLEVLETVEVVDFVHLAWVVLVLEAVDDSVDEALLLLMVLLLEREVGSQLYVGIGVAVKVVLILEYCKPLVQRSRMA